MLRCPSSLRKTLAAFILVPLLTGATAPQSSSDIIEPLAEKLRSHYVFPDVAERMIRSIREKQRSGAYKSISRPTALAEALTTDLRAINPDLHLRIWHQATVTEQERPTNAPPSRNSDEINNFGFVHAERLAGNVGYLRLDEFANGDDPRAVAVAAGAMAFLKNSDALIIDLRHNGGGYPSMVARLLGYLHGDESLLYVRFFHRPSGKTTEGHTVVIPPTERYGQSRPVFLIVGPGTASAAESFAFFLRESGRATLLGERTMGAANPGDVFDLGHGFHAFVPTGRPMSPLTGKNWEGVGIEPHNAVDRKEAKLESHLRALRRLWEDTTDPRERGRLEGIAEALERGRS